MSFDHLRITERDEKLIMYLASQGHATSEQLARQFFPSLRAFYKRSYWLRKMGLIEALSAVACANRTPGGVRGFVRAMNVRRPKVERMLIYRIAPALRRQIPFADGRHSEDHLMKHQLQLNEVRRHIEACLAADKYIVLTDVELRSESCIGNQQADLVPDLVFRGEGFDIAVELERSNKSESQLLLRFARYRDSRFTKIIYFCETEEINRRVMRIARLYTRIAVATLMNAARVYYAREFVSLGTFLKEEIA
jgi:hypothetical protein